MFNKDEIMGCCILGGSAVIAAIVLLVLVNFIFFNDCCMCGASSGCCPCPNDDYFDLIKEDCYDTISSAGSFKYCCDIYKQKYNESFECFK